MLRLFYIWNGTICSFLILIFQRSKFPTYQRMWSFMKSATPSVFVSGNKEGEGRVLKGDYAYFAESSTIEYMVERNCELMQVGQWLDSKGYGIALPQGKCDFVFMTTIVNDPRYLA